MESKEFVVYYPFDGSARVSERMLRDLMLVDKVGWEMAAQVMNKRLHTKEYSAPQLEKWYRNSKTLQALFKKELDAQEEADMTRAEYENWSARYGRGLEPIAKGQFDFFELFGKLKGYVTDKSAAINLNQTNQVINFTQADGKD